jgi:hypothetical protein
VWELVVHAVAGEQHQITRRDVDLVDGGDHRAGQGRAHPVVVGFGEVERQAVLPELLADSVVGGEAVQLAAVSAVYVESNLPSSCCWLRRSELTADAGQL